LYKCLKARWPFWKVWNTKRFYVPRQRRYRSWKYIPSHRGWVFITTTSFVEADERFFAFCFFFPYSFFGYVFFSFRCQPLSRDARTPPFSPCESRRQAEFFSSACQTKIRSFGTWPRTLCKSRKRAPGAACQVYAAATIRAGARCCGACRTIEGLAGGGRTRVHTHA